MNHTFTEKIIGGGVFISTSLNSMIRKMNDFLEENRKTMSSQVKVYNANDYSQEFLRSLIPSLKEKKDEDKN